MQPPRLAITHALLVVCLSVMGVARPAQAASVTAQRSDTPSTPITIVQVFVPLANTPPVDPGAGPQPEDPALAAQLAPARVAARTFAGEELGIPGTSLIAWYSREVREFPTIARKAFNQSFSAPLLPGNAWLSVSVDMATLERVDLGQLERAEAVAYLAKYGKMDISLWEWLQTAAPTETMAVGIWVTQTPPADAVTLAELRTADIYPEMRASMEQGGHCWDIPDMEMREMVCATYRQFLGEETAKAVQPVVEWLEARGVVVDVIESLPSVVAHLTSSLIREMEPLEIVAWLFRVDAVAEPALAGVP